MAITKRYIFATFFFTAFSALTAEEEASFQKSTAPIGAELNLSNNIGAGTAFSGYQQPPMVSSTLHAYPYFKAGPFWGDREIKVQLEASTAFEWMGENNPFMGTVAEKFALGDVKLRTELKNALHAKDLGLSLTPALKLEAPLSKKSRDANRLIGVGGYVNATWSKWGWFATYKPVVLAYAHSVPYKSGACTDESLDSDKLGETKCKLSGRQTMTLIKNGIYAGYAAGNHTMMVGFRTDHSFLRAPNSGEKPDKEVGSGIMESTLGMVEYSYNLSVSLPTTLTLGISSQQMPYDMKDGFRMPFFNFREPVKNQTEAYFAVNVSI